ncbi:unnamed protein product, partial [Urochloa humidicola]
ISSVRSPLSPRPQPPPPPPAPPPAPPPPTLASAALHPRRRRCALHPHPVEPWPPTRPHHPNSPATGGALLVAIPTVSSGGRSAARGMDTEDGPNAKRVAAAADCLPDDALVEILSRVPARSIHRFKCVSKHWCDLIADVLWNLAFVAVAVAALATSLAERLAILLRVLLAKYVLQCLLHVLCVTVEYRRRRRDTGQEGMGDGDFKLRCHCYSSMEALSGIQHNEEASSLGLLCCTQGKTEYSRNHQLPNPRT